MKNHLIPALITVSISTASALSFHPITRIATPNMVDGNSGSNPLSNVIEGVGVGFATEPPHERLGGTWYSNDPGGFPSDYLLSNPGDEIIILDFGADTVLHELSYWGYSTGNGNGLREFQVRFATDAEGGAEDLGDESFGSSITLNPEFVALNDADPRQSFPFGEPVTARYLEIRAVSNYFDIFVGGDRLGLGEFSSAEPSVTDGPDIDGATEVTLTLDPGTVTDHNFSITNTGALDLVVSDVTFSGPNADAFSLISSLPVSIGTFVNSPIEFQVDPTGLGGEISATATVTTNDPDQASFEITLSGSLPVLGPILTVASPQDLTLNENAIGEYPIQITNDGSTALSISGVTFTGADAEAFTLVSQPGNLAVDETAEIVISFDPGKVGPGAIEATMQINSNATDNPVIEVVLNGGLPESFHPISAVLTNTVNFYSELNLISGIGAGFETTWPHLSIGEAEPATWVSDAPNGGSASYFDNGQPAPVIIFDLGSNVTLGEINTWGYSNTNTNGGKEFTLRFATEAEGGEEVLGDENFGNSINYEPSFEADLNATQRQIHLFEQKVSARYVEMTITGNWRGLVDGLAGGDRVGLGEVAFPFYAGFANYLQIFETTKLGNGSFSMTFYSSPGIVYELERSTNGLDWQRLANTVEGAEGDTSVITDPAPPAEANVVLYRVVHPER
ncbi:choice-of-anchor D domain-containing protein [Verrucomicrobiaceae bacterium 227]